ncbi:MAG: tetratricopeptide repeat protein, partial [Acidimicrobiales bacterium]
SSRPPPSRQTTTIPAVENTSLIGRTAELESLAAAADKGLIVVVGEAGVGRTTLIEGWASGLGDVLVLRCHVGEQNLPYAPFARWLGDGSPSTSQLQLFEELADSIPLASGGVLVIDDLHLADTGTIGFLTYVVHRRDRFGWSVVATWQAEQVRPEDACWDLMAEGRREGWATELRLSRLEPDAIADLVRASAGASREQIQKIVDFSEGLPLLAVELMRLGPDSDIIPPIIDDLMRTRLGSISPLARQVVEALAVIDRPADEGLVQSVAGRMSMEISTAIEELGAADIVSSNGTIELTHHLLGEVALADLPSSRVKALHARAGAVLDAAEAARHVADSGQPERAGELHIHAAEEAKQAQALGSALHHLRAALALGRADDAVLQRQIGDIEAIHGRYDAARRAYEISAARSVGSDLSLVELRLARLALRTGDGELAASHLDSADAELPRSGDERLAVELAIARALVNAHGEHEGLDGSERAIALAQRLADPAVEAAAYSAAALVAYRRHQTDDVEEYAREAIRLSRLGHSPSAHAAAANLLGLIRADEGHHDEAISFFQQAREKLSRYGDVHRLAALHDSLATAFHRSGRDDEAREHQLESARLFSEVSGPPTAGRADIWSLAAW